TSLSNALSWSDDFRQDRRGGNWYLTGATRGVEKNPAKRARLAAEAAQASSLDVVDNDPTNSAEAAPTPNLPYPINVAPAHDHHPPPPTLPPSTSQTASHTGAGAASKAIPSLTRRQTRSQTRKRAAGYHPYDQPPAANAGPTMALDHNSRVNYDSQLKSASQPEIKNTPLPIFAAPKPVVAGLPGLLTNVPENPPGNIDAYPTRPSAPHPIDASFVPRTQRSPSPEGINPSAAYPGNLEVGEVHYKDVAGPSRVNQQHPLGDNLHNAGDVWASLSENHGHEDSNTLPYGNTISPAALLAAPHSMAFPGYSAVTPTTVPQDFWATYNAPVSHNPIHNAPPTEGAPSQPYPEPEIAPAGFPLDFEFS
ncbi:hypothetical protein FRC00_008284, partial [Tulasnella sp. 408]